MQNFPNTPLLHISGNYPKHVPLSSSVSQINLDRVEITRVCVCVCVCVRVRVRVRVRVHVRVYMMSLFRPYPRTNGIEHAIHHA